MGVISCTFLAAAAAAAAALGAEQRRVHARDAECEAGHEPAVCMHGAQRRLEAGERVHGAAAEAQPRVPACEAAAVVVHLRNKRGAAWDADGGKDNRSRGTYPGLKARRCVSFTKAHTASGTKGAPSRNTPATVANAKVCKSTEWRVGCAMSSRAGLYATPARSPSPGHHTTADGKAVGMGVGLV